MDSEESYDVWEWGGGRDAGGDWVYENIDELLELLPFYGQYQEDEQ